MGVFSVSENLVKLKLIDGGGRRKRSRSVL